MSDLRNKLAVPTVHLNGTSKESLVEQLSEANNAVQDALKALGQANPHMRDYYVQEDGAFYWARDQHGDRMRRLASVGRELVEVAIAIQDQQ